jgi:hypothetical protein
MKVLGDWDCMIAATNPPLVNHMEWAITFSVLLIIILVIEKSLGAAYYICEGRIKYSSHEQAVEERA